MYSKQEVLLYFGISPLTKSVRSAILTWRLYMVGEQTRPLTSRTLWVISIAEVARGEYILHCSTLVQLWTYNSLKTPTYNTSREVQSKPKYYISFIIIIFLFCSCAIQGCRQWTAMLVYHEKKDDSFSAINFNASLHIIIVKTMSCTWARIKIVLGHLTQDMVLWTDLKRGVYSRP